MEDKILNNKKRVLIFTTAYFPLTGGAEVAVSDLTGSLKDYEFDLICARLRPDLPREQKIGRVNVFRVGWGLSWDKYFLPFLGLFKALKLNKKNDYAGSWAVMISYGAFAARFLKNRTKKPYLLTLQEGTPVEKIERKVGPLRPIFNSIFKKADYVQAISGYLARWAEKAGARCPIEIVPNPVDINNFCLSPETKRATRTKLRQQFALEQDEKLIITTSRLVPKNGVADLIKALKALPGIKLAILGDGPLEKKLKELAGHLGVGDRVFFLGFARHHEIPSYLAAADIFCRPSLSEGLGTSFLEAMASGLPVVATPVGGIVDFLEDKQTGLLVRPGDPTDIAEKIKMLCENEDLAERIAKSGKNLVKEKYNREVVVEKISKIFSKVFK